jgi:uncharacterized protein YceK
MRNTALILPVLVAILAPSGCGTLANLAESSDGSPQMACGGKVVYGGVMWDATFGGVFILGGLTQGLEGLAELPLGAYLLAVDLPLSAVADTVTLPLTIPAAFKRIPQPTPEGAKAPGPGSAAPPGDISSGTEMPQSGAPSGGAR